MAKNCVNCNQEISEYDKKCDNCGAEQPSHKAPPAAPVVASKPVEMNITFMNGFNFGLGFAVGTILVSFVSYILIGAFLGIKLFP